MNRLHHKKNPSLSWGFCEHHTSAVQQLAFAELFATTCFVETHFFTLNFTSIASD